VVEKLALTLLTSKTDGQMEGLLATYARFSVCGSDFRAFYFLSALQTI